MKNAPLATPDRPRKSRRLKADRPRQLRVLIVEDNRDTAEMMKALVHEWGSETLLAHNGVQAIELAETWRPDVILLDIVLPRMHGHDVCRQLRARDWARDIPIIAVTAWGQDADKQLSRAAGISMHHIKPVDPKKLQKLLDEVEIMQD